MQARTPCLEASSRRRALLLRWSASSALAVAGLAYDPSAEAAEPKRVLGLVVGAVVLAAAVARGGRFAAPGPGVRAAMAFVVLAAISLAWGLPCGARDLGTWIAALGAGALVAGTGPRTGRRIARLLAMMLGTGASVIAIACAIGGRGGMALHAGQGNPNWLGLLLAVTLPVSMDGLVNLSRGSRTKRGALAVATAAQAAALYLSHSRVGWVAAAAACVCMGVVALRWRGCRQVAIAVAALSVLFAAAQSRAADRDVPVDLALRGRAWIWRETAHAAVHALPFGVGLGRFGHAYLAAQGEDLAPMSPGDAARSFVNATTAHDEYLQIALESGPLAAALFACALLLGARDHARSGWLGGAAALFACAVASLGDSPLRQPAVALVVGVVLAVPRVRSRGHASVVPAAIALLVTAWVLFNATRGWLATRERTRAADGDPAARVTILAKSARVDPSSGEAALDLGLAHLAVGDARGALESLRRADAQLADVSVRLALGGAFLSAGDASGAASAYRSAVAYSPGSFRARLGLAEALLAEREIEEAERQAQIARRVMPGDARGRELLDRIHEAKMDADGE